MSRSAWPVVLLVLLWLGHLVHNEAWLAADRAPLTNDTANHFRRAVKSSFFLAHSNRVLVRRPEDLREASHRFEAERPFSSHALEAPFAGPVALVRQVWVSGSYPPLGYLVAAPFLAAAGPDPDVAALALNAFFLAALLAGCYLLGRDLAGDRAGLLSALLAGCYPWLGGLSRFLLLDAPLAGTTALAIALLRSSRGFREKRGSLAFGLAAGLAMLTKHSAALFVAGPFLLAFAGCRKDTTRRANLALAFLVGLGVAGCYYLPRVVSEVKHFQKIESGGGVERDLGPGDPASYVYYAVQLVEQMGATGAAIFVLALPFFVRRHGGRALDLLLWVAVPYLLFSVFSNKDVRYTVPYLPAFAVASGVGLASIPWPRARSLAIALAGALAVLAYAHASWGFDAEWLETRTVTVYHDPERGASLTLHYPANPEFVPKRADWRTAEIRALLEAEGPPEGEVRVWILAMAEPVTHALQCSEALRWEEFRHGLAPGAFEVDYKWPGEPEIVLVPSRYFGNPGERERYVENLARWEGMKALYEEAGRVELPEGISLAVYRRRR